MNRNDGFALVLVLWVLSLLTIMAGSFALTMRREAAAVAGGSSSAKASAVAESGLAVAELMFLHPDVMQRWRTDGSVYQIDYRGASVRVRPQSEVGKVDINSADQTLLQSLLTYVPVDDDTKTRIVGAILDWRDADDMEHVGGAELKQYRDAGLSYGPRNKPFQSIEELQMVLGVNEPIYRWLENLVTVYSGQPNVDLTLAPREVLLALPGMDAGLVEQYLAARRESAIHGLPAPPAPAMSQGVASAPAAATENITPTPGTAQPDAITVAAEALLNDGTTAVIKALIKKSDNPAGSSPFQIVKWQRNAAEGTLFRRGAEQLLVRRYVEPGFDN
ncbi:MAG: general secretion pathway protein GspK [Methylobacter sp.]